MTLLQVNVARWPAAQDSCVLRDVSLAVAPGEVVLVTGESGSGKSSLLRCAVGFESFDGDVRWRGEVVQDFVTHRRRVGFLHQRPVAVGETLADNLAFSRGESRWSEADQRAALHELGLRDWADDERFDRLSGGEQQRFALVRLLTIEPSVLLLDEPTASLDGRHAREIEDFIGAWRRDDRAVVWVTHDEAQLERLSGWEGSRVKTLEADHG